MEHYNEIPLLLEMARINTPNDSISDGNKMIYIYGNDRSVMTPHFHYFNLNKTFELEIQLSNIENLRVVNSKPRKGIPKHRLKTWDGLKKEKEALIYWLSETNNDNSKLTNKEALILAWNQNNINNKIS